jgi:hypothetical protein
LPEALDSAVAVPVVAGGATEFAKCWQRFLDLFTTEAS